MPPAGSRQVNEGTQQLTVAGEQISATTQQVSDTAQELANIAEELQKAVMIFKMTEEDKDTRVDLLLEDDINQQERKNEATSVDYAAGTDDMEAADNWNLILVVTKVIFACL